MSEAEEKKPARQRVLDTAAEMFYRDGVRAVGIDALIAQSGVAKMSLYRNFPSKDALVTAWLEDRNRFFWRRWDKAEASRAGDPGGQLEAILDMIAATASHSKWRGCPFLNTATEFPEPDHPARAVIIAHKRAVRERLRALAAAARARDPDLLAQQLQLLIDGAYAIGQSLGPSGPAKTVASAGRALIAAQLAEGNDADDPSR
ncbi:MAG TPA: TetR/AcrR family transcriptional regulator [Stellaceae bacterium]|jgi:AcrR family transcriptional regulator|nr:TetR/AcrR family transcriptional regulator [Stellaceae bacterium]HEX3418909.1 TetR/AcrR family transcriptional regulator [Stellaceae bacterium]